MDTGMWVAFTFFVIIPSLIVIALVIVSLFRMGSIIDDLGDLGNDLVRKFNQFLDE